VISTRVEVFRNCQIQGVYEYRDLHACGGVPGTLLIPYDLSQ